jgi:prevent-host-death family protein
MLKSWDMAESIKKGPVTISAEELRINLADYLGRVMYGDEMIVVQKYNRDAAVIVSPRMLKRLVDANQATTEDRASALKRLEALVSQIPDNDLSEAELSHLVGREVKAVRARKRT